MGGEETVGQTAIYMTASNRKFQPLTKGMEDMASVIAGNFLRQAERMDVIPKVRGKGTSEEDIGGRYHMRVTFELVDPVLALQERELAMREYQMKLESREGYWEKARVRDSTTKRDQLLEDVVYQMPAVAQDMALTTMKRLGMKALAARLEEEAALEAQAAGVGGGQEGETPMPSEEPQQPGAPPTPASTVRAMRKPLSGAVPGQPQTRVPPAARP